MPRGRPKGQGTKGEYGELCARRPGESFWRENFTVAGRRFQSSLGTDRQKDAEIRALERRAEALKAAEAAAEDSAAPARGRELSRLTVGEAEGTYLVQVGQHKKTADDIERLARTVTAGLGEHKRLRDVTFRDLVGFIATRRMRKVRDRATGKPVAVYRAHASINREVEHFRTVIRYAAELGAVVPKIDWSKLLLDEPENKQLILSPDQEDAFFLALRPDFHPLVEMALITGQRLEALLSLGWRQIDWQGRRMNLRVKSKRPGGKPLVVPLPARAMAILGTLRGHHPERVFTYVCARNRHDPHSGEVQVKGQRYPFTQNGWRREWERARQAVGLPELRFHDLRHTAATRLLNAPGGNIRTVQKLLGHADIATTARYAVSEVDDVARAMEQVEAGRQKLREREAG